MNWVRLLLMLIAVAFVSVAFRLDVWQGAALGFFCAASNLFDSPR